MIMIPVLLFVWFNYTLPSKMKDGKSALLAKIFIPPAWKFRRGF